MNSPAFSLLLAALGVVPCHAVVVNFNYTQTDSTTGSGTIAPFLYNDGGGDISFSLTPMPSALVFNPVPGSTPAGFVGAMNAQSGGANEANTAVGLIWSGSVVANGMRGVDSFTMLIPLVFSSKVTQAPTDTNDYNWNVAFGDSPANGVDAASSALRFAFFFGRDNIVDAVETPNTFQRYTQQNFTFVAGVQESFTNTDTTTASIKDATDAGAPAGTDAAGLDLAFYYAYRDTGALSAGAILVDTFAVGGLLNTNEASLTQVPEPSASLLALGSAGLLLRRRKRA